MKPKCREERAAEMRALGLSVAEIASHFGWSYRTALSCISRGKNIEHYRAKSRAYMAAYIKAGRRKPRPSKTGRCRAPEWSDASIRYVKAAYGVLTASEIAAYVGRSRNAVIGKARRLGLSVAA